MTCVDKVVLFVLDGASFRDFRQGVNELRWTLYQVQRSTENHVMFILGADVIAVGATRCYELSRVDLRETLGVEYVDVILFCFFKHSIAGTTTLKDVFVERQIFITYSKRFI